MFYLYREREKKTFKRLMIGFRTLEGAHRAVALWQVAREAMQGYRSEPIGVVNALIEPPELMTKEQLAKSGGWYEYFTADYWKNYPLTKEVNNE